MYLRFYGLKKEPFSLSPDPSFLFLGEVHKEAFARLRYGLIQNKGFVVITGEVGTGKTTLINALLCTIPQKTRVALVTNPKLEPAEFFTLLSNAFGLGQTKDKLDFLIKLTAFLEDAQKKDEKVVLIVDEAHCLSRELLEEIRLLSNLETPNSKLINIILVGQPEFEEILSHPNLRALRQRITLRYRLEPLNLKETAKYLKIRMSKAGAKDVGIFSDAAIKNIYEFSGGIPRVINLLADHSLLTGFVKERKVIDEEIVKECAGDIGINNEAETEAPAKDKRYLGNRRVYVCICIGVLIFLLVFLAIVTWLTGSLKNEPEWISEQINYWVSLVERWVR